MPNNTTIARPYAKALFEYALEHKKLPEWSELLHTMAAAVMDKNAMEFIANPETTTVQQEQLLMALFADSGEIAAVENLIALLAHNKRLMLLPEIKVLFEVLRAEQEKTLKVKVISYSALSDTQKAQLTQSLSQRLQRQITLNISIDESLLGGAIIHAGDLIIDGSVRGKLNKLGTGLAA
ncbi:MAG: F0F1 ATP synthase subunit delta [Tatlockia sp.]|jgi:F-type H+-transporting ATPase subunit delta